MSATVTEAAGSAANAEGVGSHTAGPWEAIAGGYGDWPFEGGFNGKIVAVETRQPIFSGPSSFRALRGDTPEEALANARLMAAAPELLTELSAITTLLQFALLSTTPAIARDAMVFVRRARAVIAKATTP